uniref:Nucleotide-diphospho-sugar transferase domain-containing protein n=1 Tax=viral metagenome TaxID=1070528 RepID=A0A6C0HZ41_9ZZZZ
MFDSKSILRYAVVLTILAVSAYVGNQIKNKYASNDPEKEYELVQKYLLNDSPLYGNNKPKMWIHSKYEVNARKWESFGSRNTTNLNQPYLHLTIKSVMHHCNDDFHIMLIDDESFAKLLPDWEYGSLKQLREPVKTLIRQLGLAMLVQKYGGMVIPNSFVCTRSLKPLYNDGILDNRAFVAEATNRTSFNTHNAYVPDLYFLGSEKNNDSMHELIEDLKALIVSEKHYYNEIEFTGEIQKRLFEYFKTGYFSLIDGDLIGIKTFKKRQRIMIEDLIEERPIDLSPDSYGIYIDQEEILKRTKYQWFAVMSTEEILASSMFLAKILKKATVDSKSEYAVKPHIEILTNSDL